jgi:hypothetical protein
MRGQVEERIFVQLQNKVTLALLRMDSLSAFSPLFTTVAK